MTDEEQDRLIALGIELLGAVSSRDLSAVEAVLAKNPPINFHGPDGKASIILAAEQGDEQIVAALLRKGADRNETTSGGYSVLRAAMEARHLPVVKLLLAAGADTGIEYFHQFPRKPETDLAFSATTTPEIAAVVAEAARKFELHAAAEKGDSKKLQELLAEGLPPNTFDRHGNTPLIFAVRGNHDKSVDVLLAHKADPNMFREGTIPPLHTAVFNESVKIIRALVDAGGTAYSPDMGGNTLMQRVQKPGVKPHIYALVRELWQQENQRLAEKSFALRTDVAAPEKAKFKPRKLTP